MARQHLGNRLLVTLAGGRDHDCNCGQGWVSFDRDHEARHLINLTREGELQQLGQGGAARSWACAGASSVVHGSTRGAPPHLQQAAQVVDFNSVGWAADVQAQDGWVGLQHAAGSWGCVRGGQLSVPITGMLSNVCCEWWADWVGLQHAAAVGGWLTLSSSRKHWSGMASAWSPPQGLQTSSSSVCYKPAG